MDVETDFPSTHWSELARLNGAQSRRALEALIERYWRPAYGYLRNLRRLGPEEALDLTQEFFARVLERGKLGDLAPGRGSFRGYLKTCLQNFTVSSARAVRARRPRDSKIFHFDLTRGEWQRLAPESGDSTPDAVFDREWARGVLEDGFRRCREVLEGEGKGDYYRLFSQYYLEPTGLRPSHEELARKYEITPSEVNNHLRTVRALLKRLLQERVVEYLGAGEDPEAELAFIFSQD